MSLSLNWLGSFSPTRTNRPLLAPQNRPIHPWALGTKGHWRLDHNTGQHGGSSMAVCPLLYGLPFDRDRLSPMIGYADASVAAGADKRLFNSLLGGQTG